VWALLCNEELKVVLKLMGTTQNICCRYHMNIANISSGTVFWTQWNFFAHLSEYYTPWKPVTIFNTSAHKNSTNESMTCSIYTRV
jgi:hypothetical protein